MKENIFKSQKPNFFEVVGKSAILSQEIPFKNIIIASFLINLLVIGLIFLIRKNYLPPQVPLFYGLPEGEAQLVPSIDLIFPSLFSLVIISINILLLSFIKDDFLKNTLSIASLIVTFFSLITTLKIIFLIGSF